jgi:hypothetical protein
MAMNSAALRCEARAVPTRPFAKLKSIASGYGNHPSSQTAKSQTTAMITCCSSVCGQALIRAARAIATGIIAAMALCVAVLSRWSADLTAPALIREIRAAPTIRGEGGFLAGAASARPWGTTRLRARRDVYRGAFSTVMGYLSP